MENGNLYKTLLDSLSEGIFIVDRNRLITYWNKGAEGLTGYNTAETVGQCCHGDIFTYVDGQGTNVCEKECLALKSITTGQPYSMEVYARHKGGHRVPILIRTAPIKGHDGQIIGAVEEFRDNSSKIEFTHKIEEIERCALLDPLTGVMKKFGLEMNLKSVFGVIHRYGWSYGIYFIDIDEFKTTNEAYGREVGDNILKMVARTLLNSVRAVDIVGRWGGEEFLVIAANIREDHLYSLANKIRILVERSALSVGTKAFGVTVSVCATMIRPNDTINSLLKRIDQLMEHNKTTGKNCVSVKLDV